MQTTHPNPVFARDHQREGALSNCPSTSCHLHCTRPLAACPPSVDLATLSEAASPWGQRHPGPTLPQPGCPGLLNLL